MPFLQFLVPCAFNSLNRTCVLQSALWAPHPTFIKSTLVLYSTTVDSYNFFIQYFRDSTSGLRTERKHRPALALVRRLLPLPEHLDGGPVFAAHWRPNLGLRGDAVPRPLDQAVQGLIWIDWTTSGVSPACSTTKKVCFDLSTGKTKP